MIITMLAGRDTVAMANPTPDPAPARRLWAAGALLLLLLVLALAATGETLAVTAVAAGRRFAAGGVLHWSDGASPWEEVPLTVELRRLWGPSDRFLQPRWEQVAAGLATAELHFLRPPDPRAVKLVLLDVEPAHWRLRVWGRDDWSRADVATLADEAGLIWAVNGPYFAADGPLGLVVSDGVVRNRQGSRRPAHFLVDGPGRRPRILNERGAAVTGIDQGFQGFPAIMTSGRTFGYLRTGGRGFSVSEVDRRTAACTDTRGHLLVMATDSWTSGLSLSELATVMGGLGCVDGMAFDGGASTSLWLDVPGSRRHIYGFDDVPVVLGASPRAPG